MKKFELIYQRALKRKGEQELLDRINVSVQNSSQLKAISSDRYLALITKAIFKAGFVWKIIDYKWPGFEQAFWNFNVTRCAWISPDDLDTLYCDSRVIKNATKINTVQANATMILELDAEQGSFVEQVADWPADDFIGLLDLLHKRGSRLGKLTSQYFLRSLGKDGFVLSRDVVAALIDAAVIDKPPTSKAEFLSIQNAFNCWMDETGYGLTVISRILGLSIDA
ncbi:MAG: 3-methyladenine DNA glycosylase [Gammaproteobacteria bacterium]|nr:MAG: 3-methyladenine DNA glycosylase [Gammaproteobacteria bacterium]